MKHILSLLDGFIENACKALLVVTVILVSIVVVGRFVFNDSPGWGDQGSLLCTVWLGLLCSTIAIKEGSHLNITAAERLIPKRALKYLDAVNTIFMLLFALFMIVEGTKLAILASSNIITGLSIKSSWLYASVPFTGLVLLIQLVRKMGKTNDVE